MERKGQAMVLCCCLQQSEGLCSLLSPLNLDFETFTLFDFQISLPVCVLGLARTGLIFTGLQEGAQPGGGG